MHRLEEVLRPQRCIEFLDHPVVDQRRAQERRLGLHIGGQRPRGDFIGAGDQIGLGHGRLNARGCFAAQDGAGDSRLWIAGMKEDLFRAETAEKRGAELLRRAAGS